MRFVAICGLICVFVFGCDGQSRAFGQTSFEFHDATATALSAPSLNGDLTDRDFAIGDFDGDGDMDLAVMRRPPFQYVGSSDVLLMNVGGVLTDLTATYATASTVVGSNGFSDLTCDIDVVAVDVTGDGRLDLVTAAHNGGASAKYLTHPRVYVNRGPDASGQWQGFIFDDENRIPTMLFAPEFVAISAGDIDNDGDQDLVLGSIFPAGGPPSGNGDRLLVNGGNGYFTDETATRLSSSFVPLLTVSIHLVDINSDGLVDIVKNHTGTGSQPNDGIFVVYNGQPSPGYFFATLPVRIYSGPSWSSGIVDIDANGLPDVMVGHDLQDQYMLNTGVGPSGFLTTFAAPENTSYAGGGADDGFCGNIHSADFDLDGYPEVVVADVDVVAQGLARRCHLFRNLGPGPGSRLLEETVAGAVGGIPTSNLSGTFDAAPIDVDGDGFTDLVLARSGSTTVWRNKAGDGVDFTFPAGRPDFQATSGPTTVLVDVRARRASATVDPSSVTMYVSVNFQPFVATAMQPAGPDLYLATFPANIDCTDGVRYFFEASISWPFAVASTNPGSAPTASYFMSGAFGIESSYIESFESTAPGWTVVNAPSLTAGAWQTAVPNATGFLGQLAAPGSDSEPGPGFTRCFVTQNGVVGATANASDVDGGPTTLISPPFDVSGGNAVISYDRWFFASSLLRSFIVEVSGNGTNWVTVETVTHGTVPANVWTRKSFRVADFIVPTSTVQVRFSTQDMGGGVIVEAGIDRFTVDFLACTTCQPNLGYGGPGNLALSLCGGNLSSGTTAELVLTGAIPNDVAYLGASFTADLLPIYGGTLVSPNLFYIATISTDAAGEYRLANIPGGLGNVTIYLQAFQVDGSLPELIAFSNIVEARFLP